MPKCWVLPIFVNFIQAIPIPLMPKVLRALLLYLVPSYNVSLWDVMVGKNKGQTLLDHIIQVESATQADIGSSSSMDSILNDPRVVPLSETKWPYSED